MLASSCNSLISRNNKNFFNSLNSNADVDEDCNESEAIEPPDFCNGNKFGRLHFNLSHSYDDVMFFKTCKRNKSKNSKKNCFLDKDLDQLQREYCLLKELNGQNCNPMANFQIDLCDFRIQARNRYSNIYPSPNHRVKLNVNSIQDLDYINASWIQTQFGNYIMTQAPLPETIEDFWSMVWDQDVKIITMLTDLQERGRIKSTKYWDSCMEPGVQKMSKFTIKKYKSSQKCSNFRIRFFELTNNQIGQSKKIVHLHFTGWGDFCTPKILESIINLLNLLDKFELELNIDKYKNPIIFHCSAGVGRAGTTMAIKIAHEELKNGNLNPNIYEIVKKIRISRPGSVQNVDQYKYIYQIVSILKPIFN